MQERAAEIDEFAREARSKFDTFVLLGMGGSSLAPEVLKRTFDEKQLHVLDTTHPADDQARRSRARPRQDDVHRLVEVGRHT